MSQFPTILSKKVRHKFKAKLTQDDSAENPRLWGEPLTNIHLWNGREEDLPASRDIQSYEEAIYSLFKGVYPELIERCLNDEPPLEILELIGQTEYPGVALWITRHGGYETNLHADASVDPNDRHLTGVTFIEDETLEQNGLSRAEGEIMLRNDLLTLEQYINGNVYLLKVAVDGESEYYGEIYPLQEKQGENGEPTGRIRPLVSCYTPPEEILNECLMESATSDEDRKLIAEKPWK